MNVVVIIADSLRQDHLGCYGNQWISTPNLDALARESLICEHSYPENVPTIPTRLSWWTGKYGFANRHWSPLRTDDVVLPEVLWDQDVKTALVTDVYHMHKPGMGFGRGFDDVRFIRGQEYDPYVTGIDVDVDASPFHHLPAGADNIDGWRDNYEQYLRNQSRIHDEDDTYIAQTTREAMNWIERRRADEPFFLWLDCFDPHEPWDPPEPYWSMYKDSSYTGAELIDPVPGLVQDVISHDELIRTGQLYAAEVSLVDAWVGKLTDRLRETGLYDDTLIVFTTDHGEPFGDHGIVRKCRPWLHEELVRTPMLIRTPGGKRAGERTNALMQAPDLMPTILEAFGVEPPVGVQGVSWWPLLNGETDTLHPFACTGARTAMGPSEWSIRDQNWSLLLPFTEVEGDRYRGTQLYDRNADQYEQTNLLGENSQPEHREHAVAMELELRRFADTVITS
jgi:arylsulfatase A-like enzyme